MEVRFIDGPIAGRVIPLSDKTAKLIFDKQNNLDLEKDITYTIRQENGEWIGEMEE